MKKKPKVTFKRCNKKEWKDDPSYTVRLGGKECGYIYFFNEDKEPSFEMDDWVVGTFFQVEDLEIFSIIRKKLIEFKKEVYSESKKK